MSYQCRVSRVRSWKTVTDLEFVVFPAMLYALLLKDFPWVHDSIGIQKFLDLFHQEKAFSMLRINLSSPHT